MRICFMIFILTFWVSKMALAKTNSITPERSEALKRQITATWSAMRLNHFDVIWTYFKCFEATSSYYSIMLFLKNFPDFWVFVFECRAENENPEITENLYFFIYFFFVRLYPIGFCVYISLFSVVGNTTSLFNCFFRDFRGFRGFRDFWGFDQPISSLGKFTCLI